MTFTFWRRRAKHGGRRSLCLALFQTALLAVLTLAIGGMTMNSMAEVRTDDDSGDQSRIFAAMPVTSGKIGKAPILIKVGQSTPDKTMKKARKPSDDDCEQNPDTCDDAHPSAKPFAEENYCEQFPKSQQCYCEANPDAKRCKAR